ncbi:baculoviral IAP repeat-containing protein 7-A [Caerostris extrusa]|uniref:Baculoviral IAP repeat-containing protein 7-A n=1 Tax=Caerostris extrusa TaxID=172846 RepID=A0AAV4VB26_CAEEX|nr:baculoviral IAP repeat-containing protein 7-A [Caerostris extrusa]
MDLGLSIPDNEKEILDVMKYEGNQYNSFMGRWPLSYITPKDLAKNGFFHLLLSEDRGAAETKTCEKSLSKLIPNTKSNSTSLSGQAKYPMMTELNNRLATYKDWPLIMLSPRQLSECGLFYTAADENNDLRATCKICMSEEMK